MKKNVLKILLAFMVLAMMFALVACGDSGKSGKNSGGNKRTNTDDTKDNEKIETSPEELSAAINKVIENVDPLFETIKGIKKENKVALDIGLGGYFTNDQKGGGFKVNAAVNANADATDPEFKFGVAVNTKSNKDSDYKDYFSLGYNDGAIYLLEGLNLINSTATNSNKIKMDVAYFKDGINNAVTQAMAVLEGVVSNETFKKIKLSDFTDAIDRFKVAIAALITLKQTDNLTELILESEKIADLVDFLKGPMVLGQEKWNKIAGTVNQVLGYVAKAFPNVKELQDLTLDVLLEEFAPSLDIKAEYKNDALSNVKVAIAFGENLKNLEVGLSIDLNAFGIDDKKANSDFKRAEIDFSGYTQQALSTKLGVNLGGINQKAELELNLNTGSGLATENANLATAFLTLNGDKQNAAKASFDGAAFNMDIDKFVTKLGFETNANTQFTQPIKLPTYTVGDDGSFTFAEESKATNVKTWLKGLLEGLKYVKGSGTTEGPTLPAGIKKFESKGIWATIYNLLLFEGTDYVNADNQLVIVELNEEGTAYTSEVKLDKDGKAIVTKKKATATSDDVLNLLSDYIVKINEKAGDFLNFKVVGDDGKALPFKTIWENIKTQFNQAKTIFTDKNGAAKAEGTEASVVLFGNNGKSLIDFVSYFVKVPGLKEDGTPDITITKDAETGEETWTYGETTNTINAALIKAYVEWVFGLDDEDAAESYAEWNESLKNTFGIGEEGFTTDIVELVLGKSYEEVIDGGIVAYAKYDANKGLSGEVGLKAEDGTIYLGLSGSIGFSSNADISAVAVDGALTLFDDEANWIHADLWNYILNTIDYIFHGAKA